MTLRNIPSELDLRTPPAPPTDDPIIVVTPCARCTEWEREVERLNARCAALEGEVEHLQGFLSAKERAARQRGDEVLAHANDPATSKFAANLLSGPRRWNERLRVLEAVIYCTHHRFDYDHPRVGPVDCGGGLTDDELTGLDPPMGLGLNPDDAYSTFRTCRTELRDLLIVRNTGSTRPSWSMSNRATKATVWAAVPDAMERFEALREEARQIRLQEDMKAASIARAVALMRQANEG